MKYIKLSRTYLSCILKQHFSFQLCPYQSRYRCQESGTFIHNKKIIWVKGHLTELEFHGCYGSYHVILGRSVVPVHIEDCAVCCHMKGTGGSHIKRSKSEGKDKYWMTSLICGTLQSNMSRERKGSRGAIHWFQIIEREIPRKGRNKGRKH